MGKDKGEFNKRHSESIIQLLTTLCVAFVCVFMFLSLRAHYNTALKSPKDARSQKLGHDGVELHLVAPWGVPRSAMCYLVLGALHNGFDLRLYDAGHRDKQGTAVQRKAGMVLKALDGLPDADLVLVLDGTDCVVNGTPDEVYAAFLKLDHEMIVSAQRDCPAEGILAEECSKWEDAGVPYRWPNAGGYMGRVRTLRPALTHMTGCKNCTEGEAMLTLFNNTRFNGTIVLDYFQSIWQNQATEGAEDGDLCAYVADEHISGLAGDDDPQLKPFSYRLRNCLTNSTPLVYHFNGRQGEALTRRVKQMWWWGNAVPAKTSVKVNNHVETIAQYCSVADGVLV